MTFESQDGEYTIEPLVAHTHLTNCNCKLCFKRKESKMEQKELKIDPELRDLLPPLTDDEYKQLEKNIVENGFDKNFPIMEWNGFIVDGHNRYSICKKHNIDYVVGTLGYETKNEFLREQLDLLKRKKIDENLEWQDVADFRSEYNGDLEHRDTVRKGSKLLYEYIDAGWVNEPVETEDNDNAELIKMRKEKIKLSDARVEYNRLIRQEARKESYTDMVKRIICENVEPINIPVHYTLFNSSTDLLCHLTDIHCGIEMRKVYSLGEKSIDDIIQLDAPIVSTMNFTLNIEPIPIDYDDIESSYEFDALTEALCLK